MPHSRRWLPALILCALAAGIAYLGWTTYPRSAAQACSICERPVHLASRVDGEAEGETLTFCCAACALHAREGSAPDLNIKRAFDYNSGKALDPNTATAVVGSEINQCMRDHVLMDAHKEASELHFDRYSPSILSFADPQSAARFRSQHGGEVRPFVDLLKPAE